MAGFLPAILRLELPSSSKQPRLCALDLGVGRRCQLKSSMPTAGPTYLRVARPSQVSTHFFLNAPLIFEQVQAWTNQGIGCPRPPSIPPRDPMVRVPDFPGPASVQPSCERAPKSSS